jgi:hypothetical protein
MSLINIISAVGNNRGIAPLFVRDCCIEIPTKLGLTYKQNFKDSKQMANNAVRERFIDEYGTSAIWMGGPVIIGKFCDWAIKKCGYNPGVNMSLFKERKDQGIKYNIERFREKAPEAVKDLEKALLNRGKYQKLQAGKFALTTAIPIALMGFILPKLNYKLTEKIREKQRAGVNIGQKTESDNNAISFKGLASTMANMSNVNKMAVTDGGLTIGRVWTGRNRYEQMELGFKNSMMMFLNFVFPIYLAKGLNKLSMKLFNTNVNLDPKLMNNKDFLGYIKEKSLDMPKNRGEVIDFLDKNRESRFAKLCEEYCGVKYLKNGVRDPREFVDTKKIIEFKNEITRFSKEILNSGDINKYAKKAVKIKSANIAANVGISSFLLAAALPELIFFLREKITGSKAEPGLISVKN